MSQESVTVEAIPEPPDNRLILSIQTTDTESIASASTIAQAFDELMHWSHVDLPLAEIDAALTAVLEKWRGYGRES